MGVVLAALPVFASGLAISETTGQALTTFGKRDTVSSILTEIEDAASCVACNVRLTTRFDREVLIKVIPGTVGCLESACSYWQ